MSISSSTQRPADKQTNLSPDAEECVRKLLKQSKVRPTLYIADTDHHRVLYCESNLERAHAHILMNDPNIVAFDCQPETVYPYPSDSDIRYTPDAKAIDIDGCETIYEVKDENQINSPDLEEKHRLIREFYKKRGITFKVINGTEIAKSHLFKNLIYLRPFKGLPVSPVAAQLLAEHFNYGTTTVEAAQEACFLLELAPYLVPLLVVTEMIHFDLAQNKWPQLEINFAPMQENA